MLHHNGPSRNLRISRRDGRDRRQEDERVEVPVRGHVVERIPRGLGVPDEERSLAEVVEEERRGDEREPVDLDRDLAEVPHVGIERLAAGRHQEDPA